MAYGTRWNTYRSAAEVIAEAERRAGPSELGYLYRFEDHTYAASSGWDDDHWISTGPYMELTAFAIRKVTPCGWWIDGRWVNSQGRYAWPTVKEAVHSFLMRKKRQGEIYYSRMLKAQEMAQVAGVALAELERSEAA